MDSQLTLIDPPSADAVLVFDRPNFRNFTLRQKGFENYPLYVVSTSKDFTRTEISDGSKNVLVVIEQRTFLPDQVTFTGHKPLRQGAWLKPTTIFPMVYEWQGQTFSWKADQAARLAMYVDGAALSDPIAWYEGARMSKDEDGQVELISPSRLSLRGVATDPGVRDSVLASFLICVSRSRISHNHYEAASGRAMAERAQMIIGPY